MAKVDLLVALLVAEVLPQAIRRRAARGIALDAHRLVLGSAPKCPAHQLPEHCRRHGRQLSSVVREVQR